MRLFLYGTLLDPNLLDAIAGHAVATSPATLRGWRRVALPGNRYPTLRRGPGVTAGAVITVTPLTRARLALYEGPSYRLTHVVVHTASGRISAKTWIAPGGTLRDWPAS